MRNTVQAAYDLLVNSKEFLNEGFLSSFFSECTPESIESEDWYVHFYNPNKGFITTYFVGEEVHVVSKDENVFSEEINSIEELELSKVKISFDSIISKCSLILKEIDEKPNKIIILLLQKSGDVLWNITYVTERFNLVNIKINAVDSSLIDRQVTSLFSFGNVDSDKSAI